MLMAKIIKFPGQNREPSQNETNQKIQADVSSDQTTFVAPSFVIPKAILWSSLCALLIVGVAFERISPSVYESQIEGQRSLASVSETDRASLSSQNEIVEKLKTKGRRDIASLGAEATSDDRLRFEILDSRYHFIFQDGKISSIEFTPDWSSGGGPRYIPELEVFLGLARELLPVEYEAIHAMPKERHAQGIKQVVTLEGASKRTVAHVEFDLDPHGRFLSMKVQPAAQ